MAIAGWARIAGKEFGFPAREGYGLIQLEGDWTLVRFSCPLETLSPQGHGIIVSQSFKITVADGRLYTQTAEPIHLGVERLKLED